MFAGLMSRWMMPSEWAASSASAISIARASNTCLHGLSGDAMLQRHAVQELHDEERMAVLLPDLMDRADIGMVESRGRLRLPLETSQCLGVSGHLVRQELQGNKTMESSVLGLVDDT